ncbi:MAG: hypothetical protein ABFD81_02510 [Syntrophaceae bacterium]
MKESVRATTEYAESLLEMSRVLGITTEAAANLRTALTMEGLTTESYIGANVKLTRQLKANEDSLNKIGITTRDSNGNLVSQTQLFQNAIEAMKQYKEGTDRNEFAMFAFGRSGVEVIRMMKLTEERMQEGKDIAQRYGLVMGQDAALAAEKFGDKMNILKIINESLKIQIGNALIPQLASLGGWLSSTGPTAVNAFAGAIKGIITFIGSVITGFKAIVDAALIVGATIYSIIPAIKTMGKALWQVAHGDIKGATETIKTGMADAKAYVTGAVNMMVDDMEKARARLKNLWMPGETPAQENPVPKGSKSFENPKESDEADSRFSQWQSDLEQMKMSEKAYFDFSLDRERAYWTGKLSLAKKGTEEYRSVQHQIFALNQREAREELQSALDTNRAKQNSEKTSWEERLALEDKNIAKIKAAYGADGREYKRSLLEKQRMTEDFEQYQIQQRLKEFDLTQQINALDLQDRRANVEQRIQLGIMTTDEELAALRDLADAEYQINLQRLQSYADTLKQYPERYKEVLGQIKLLEKKHAVDLSAIQRKAVDEQKSFLSQLMSPVQSSITSSIQGIIHQTTTLKESMVNIFNDIVDAIISMLVNIAAKTITSQMATATTSTAIRATEASANVGISAAEGAAAAASSTAAIPVVGPFMAAGIAASMFASILAWRGRIASASGGWDVDRDALTQIHKDEMILNPSIAGGFREMFSSYGGGMKTAGRGRGNGAVNIYAADTKSFMQMFKSNRGGVASMLREMVRNRSL